MDSILTCPGFEGEGVTIVGPYTALGALENEYVVKRADGTTMAVRGSEMIRITADLRQYVETALWSSSVEEGGLEILRRLRPDDVPERAMPDWSMDRSGFTIADLAPEALESMREDLEGFLSSADEGCQAALEYWREQLGETQASHDFWLTRNGHGAGFWDRFADPVGSAHGNVLTAMAKPYGESTLYVGDDGKIYAS